MLDDEEIPMSRTVKLVAALASVTLALIGIAFLWGYFMERPHPPEPIRLGKLDQPREPPPPGPLDERVRTYFFAAHVEQCMKDHLPRTARVDGVAYVDLSPDGSVGRIAVDAEPAQPAVVLCMERRFARGFAYEGRPVRVEYWFAGKWTAAGEVSLNQNTNLRELP